MSFLRNLMKPGLREYLRNGEPVEIFSEYSEYCEYIRESKPAGDRHRFAVDLLPLYERYEMETDLLHMKDTLSTGSGLNVGGLWKASGSEVDHKAAVLALEFARRAVKDFESK